MELQSIVKVSTDCWETMIQQKIIKEQLQAVKARVTLQLGCAGKVWDLPSRGRVVSAVSCSTLRPQHHICRWIHSSCSRFKGGEGEKGVPAPLRIKGSPAWLCRSQPWGRHSQEHTASRVAWKSCQSQITHHITLTAFKMFFISTLVIFSLFYVVLFADPSLKPPDRFQSKQACQFFLLPVITQEQCLRSKFLLKKRTKLSSCMRSLEMHQSVLSHTHLLQSREVCVPTQPRLLNCQSPQSYINPQKEQPNSFETSAVRQERGI